MKKIADTTACIATHVVRVYKTIENGFVCAYKKIENGAVAGFAKLTDKCVEVLFARSGEGVEEAKKRLQGNR